MDKGEIKQIANSLKDLDEDLNEQGCRGLTDLGHITKLHVVIKRLMDATLQTTDQKLKPFLATLAMKARRYKDYIEMRLRLGYGFSTWSVARLAQHRARVTGIRSSDDQLRRLLHQEGFSIHRAKHTLRGKRDEHAYQKAKKDLIGLKKSDER